MRTASPAASGLGAFQIPADGDCHCGCNSVHVRNAQLIVQGHIVVAGEEIFDPRAVPAGIPINCEKLVVTPLTAQASRMEEMMFTPAVPSTITGPLSKSRIIDPHREGHGDPGG